MSGNTALPQRTSVSVKGVRVEARPCQSVVPSVPSARLTLTTSCFPSGTSSSSVTVHVAGSRCVARGSGASA